MWLIILLPYALLAYRFWFVCDDAFISFRFSRNWAEGLGIRYNLGEHVPVEGYSNFLWMALAAVVERLGASVAVWMPLFSWLCGAALLIRLYETLIARAGVSREAAMLAGWTLALFPPFAVWSTSGLATMPQALLSFLLFERLAFSVGRRPWLGAGIAAAMLALIRVEGFAWVLGITLVAAWLRSGRTGAAEAFRQAGLALVIAASVVAMQAGWRLSYYEALMPNTALVKVDFGAARISRGLTYVGSFLLTFLTPLLLLPAGYLAWRRSGRLALAFLAVTLAYPAYAVMVGGDYMTMARLLIPGLAFGAFLYGLAMDGLWRGREESALSAAWGKKAGAAAQAVAGRTSWKPLSAGLVVMALGILPAFNTHVLPASLREKLHFRMNKDFVRTEYGQWEQMSYNSNHWRMRGQALAQAASEGDSLVAAAIGAVGYYSRLFIYDRNGLVTREVALLPAGSEGLDNSPGHDKTVEREYFLKHEPTFLQGRLVEDAASIIKWARVWSSPKTRGTYVPDFIEVSGLAEPQWKYLVMLRRLRDAETAGKARRDFHRRLDLIEDEIGNKEAAGAGG